MIENRTLLRKKIGTVYLVGAGPGDKGLITVRGLRLVEKADAVVYDQLGAPTFLNYARPDAKLIDVGKIAGKHTLPQEEINKLLVELALEGLEVVRLKGGDPMVFGRGGEELEALVKAGVPFEVVPGVSSAIAGPTYAGISITHRGYTSVTAFVTGHEADIKEASSIPWSALALIDSLVFLMGVKQLAQITKNLINHGKPPDTPVALIEQATTPLQRTITGRLDEIADIAIKNKVSPPALIVVGQIVNLRKTLAWFEKKPLFGKTIIVTRSRQQASDLVEKLEQLGARTIMVPTIKIQKIEPNPDLEQMLEQFAHYNYLVFTSVNGVSVFFDFINAKGYDARILHNKKIICIGPATAQEVKRYGIIPDFIPSTYQAESLISYFKANKNGAVALLRAEKAREVLPEELKKLGFSCTIIPVYKTVIDNNIDLNTKEILRTGKYDLVTFTSTSTVDNFYRLTNELGIYPNKVSCVAIGPITEASCKKVGFNVLATASEFTIPGLIDCILEVFRQ